MISRVCFLVNYNLYESKRHFTQKLMEALNRLNIETHLIDLQENPFEAETALEIQEFAPDLTASFNSIQALPSGKFLWDILQIPHLSIIVDPIQYSMDLIKSPLSIITCVDRFDCEYVRKQGFNNIFFWPHATDKDLQIKGGEKPYDIVLIGSCYDYESMRNSWKERYSPKIQKALASASEMVLANRTMTLVDALTAALKECRAEPSEYDFMTCFYDFDNCVRGFDRVNLVRAIKDYPVHIFGDMMSDDDRYQLDWRDYLSDKPNVTVHSGVPFATSLEVLQLSKICLNSVPSFKNGTHERIFNSLACGALPLSSPSIYLEECFKAGKEIAFYQHGYWDELNATIDDILIHEKKRQTMVEAGRAKVMAEHTWDARARQLVEHLSKL